MGQGIGVLSSLNETEQKEFMRLFGVITSTLENELSKGRSPNKEK